MTLFVKLVLRVKKKNEVFGFGMFIKDEEDDVIVSSTGEKYVARTGASLGYKKNRRSSRGILKCFCD